MSGPSFRCRPAGGSSQESLLIIAKIQLECEYHGGGLVLVLAGAAPPAPATFLAVIVCCESGHGHWHQAGPSSNILTPKFQGDWREDSRHRDTAELLPCAAAFLQGTKTSGEGRGAVLGGGGDSKWLISISLWSLEDNDVLAAGTNTVTRCSGHVVLTKDRKQSK